MYSDGLDYGEGALGWHTETKLSWTIDMLDFKTHGLFNYD